MLDEFNVMGFLSDVAPLREYVGDNLHHLRKLASIKKAGYYQQPDYLGRLMQVSQAEGWELKIVNGKIHMADPIAAQAKLDLTTAFNDVSRSIGPVI